MSRFQNTSTWRKKKNNELPLEQNTRQSVDSSGYTETTQGTHQSNKSSGKKYWLL